FLTQEQADSVQRLTAFSPAARLANAVQSYGWYLARTFWPTDLAAFYCHPRDNWQWGPVLLSGAVLLVVTGVALVRARQWSWLLGTLLPVIGLVQVGGQARADRYVYVPHLGLFVALVWSGAALLQRLRVPGAVQTVLAGLCLLLSAALTWAQVGHWRSSETL